MTKPQPLIPGSFYHIYNRGNNRETIFRTAENYRFFLERYAHYIELVATTYAYCLLPNHFHLLVYIRPAPELPTFPEVGNSTRQPHHAFKNLFISYALAYNRRYQRTGSLFQKPFKRKRVDKERYFMTLVTYIHRNPQKHGLVDDFRDWPWSSYPALISEKPTKIQRTEVIDWYGSRANFINAHSIDVDEKSIAHLL
jgi:REP element-mobilizing transposase RayT